MAMWRQHKRDLGMMMKEVDKDLAIFLGILRNNNNNNHHNHHNSDEENDTTWHEEAHHVLVHNNNNHQFDEINNNISTMANLPLSEEEQYQQHSNIPLQSQTANTGMESPSSGRRKPAPRATMPNAQRASSPKPCPASTPTSKATPRPSRASTPTSRTNMLPSSRTVPIQARSSPTPSPSSTTASRCTMSTKTSSTMLENPIPSQNLKMPKRPASVSRGRPSTLGTNTFSSNGKPGHKSCSPAKLRAAPKGTIGKNRNETPSRSRGYCNSDGEDVNPVLIGTKLVQRLVNMRKLAPPKQFDQCSAGKSSRESVGFGRSLSNASLEMALRHMDIRRSVDPDMVSSTAVSSSWCPRDRSNCGKSNSGRVMDYSPPPTSSASESNPFI